MCSPLNHNREVEPLWPVCQGETRLDQTRGCFVLFWLIYSSDCEGDSSATQRLSGAPAGGPTLQHLSYSLFISKRKGLSALLLYKTLYIQSNLWESVALCSLEHSRLSAEVNFSSSVMRRPQMTLYWKLVIVVLVCSDPHCPISKWTTWTHVLLLDRVYQVRDGGWDLTVYFCVLCFAWMTCTTN